MNPHPYLRAYMAGIVAPTLFLLVAITGFCVARYGFAVPIPIERVIVFPMAIVPNLFGLWNVFYLWLGPRRHLPIGLHGAVLPFVVAPLGATIATLLGFLAFGAHGLIWFEALMIPYTLVATALGFAVVVYYLVWKHLVGFFNEVLGIA